MSNAVFFPALSTISPPLTTEQKWRVCTKTSNTYDSFLTVEMVFRYIDNPAQFDISGNYMTLFHMGTDSTTSGVDIVLRKIGSNPIQLGYRTSTGTAWTTVESSFVSLNSIGNVNTDGFYFMLSYNYNNPNKIINFYVVTYNNTSKTTYDFSYTNSSAPAINPIGNQWGFGSLPQALIDPNGYDNSEGYNAYIAQNLQVNFLRTWNVVIPATSSTNGQYAMFNTAFSAYSLYNINKSFGVVPAGTTNLNFQLFVPSGSTNLSDLANNAVSPSVAVTLATNASNYPTLNPPTSYNFAVNSTTNFIVVQASQIPCLLEGTKILTNDGYKLIVTLNIGDYVQTHDNRTVEIIDIKKWTVFGSETNCPLLIEKGKYGAFEDLYLSFGHSILIENEFCHAFRLNLPQKIENKLYTYYSLKLPNFFTDTLIANGVMVEGWDGWTFDNQTEVPREYLKENGNRILLNPT
jgi:hypothetical protein